MPHATRRSARAQEMLSVVQAFKASDLTLNDFGRLHGVAPSTLRYWMKKVSEKPVARRRGRRSPAGHSPFAPVTIIPDPPRSSSSHVEISLETGRTMAIPVGCDPDLATRLLETLI